MDADFARFDPFLTRMISATTHHSPDHNQYKWIKSVPANSGLNKYFAVTFTEV